MSTLADLRTRIITETNRSDLADVLASQLDLSIQDSISDYANERFWFNEVRTTGSFVQGSQYTDLPSGQYFVDRVFITVGSVNFPLRKTTNEEIERLYLIPQIGQPYLWAPYETQARLWPTPNVTYPSIWLTISDVAALDYTNGASSNYWTNQGQWLICARAKCFLYLNVFKDPDGYSAAMKDLNDAYANIKGQTNRQLSTGRLRAAW